MTRAFSAVGFLIFQGSAAWGLEATAPRPLIQMEWRTFSGMKYSIEGRVLKGLRPLENLIRPTGDARALGLLKTSRRSKTLGWILLGSAYGALAVSFQPRVPENEGLYWDLSSIGLEIAGGLFLADSGAKRFNAVQRYNRSAGEGFPGH